jgi:hypothetical protein
LLNRFGFCLVLIFIAEQLSAAPVAQAVRVLQAPGIDGKVSTDPAWQHIQPITGFTQVQPNEGAAASQRTDVYVGFDDSNLYIGLVCHDTDPEKIIVSSNRRDGNLSDMDSFRMIIDAFQSRQNGLVFGTNPGGMAYDGQLTEENSFDLNWDTTWEVQAETNAAGWSAEFAIPFSSLRYGAGVEQTWGFNFERVIRRNNEVVFWAPIPLQFSLGRVSLAGSVAGLQVPPQKNFKVIPYITNKLSRGPAVDGSDNDTEVGVDIKYSLTPSLTLDATYNTDFAQVEVDQLRVNLNRFSLFFPEKRAFFLENAGQFSVGAQGQMELFFSRRIGISSGGDAIPIEGGVRVSGKVGDATNLGLLAMRSEEVAGVAPQTDFAVVRVKQELANRSSLGVLLVNRDGGGSDNQTYAIDGRWGIGNYGSVDGFIAKTTTPGIEDDDHAIYLTGAYNSDVWSYNASYSEVGSGFNPEVGFLFRNDYQRGAVFVQRRVRASADSKILEFRPHARYSGYWRSDGFYETGFLHLDNATIWKSGAELHTAVNLTHEGVLNDFQIAEGVVVPAADYDEGELSLSLSTDRGAPFSLSMNLRAGGFFGGDRLGLSPGIRYRYQEAFSSSLSWDYNDVDLPGGAFDVGLTSLRVSYSFSPKMTLQALVQHNDRDKILATNIRFSWLQSANSGLFVVYNETDDERNAPGRPRRDFLIKYSHIFDVL